MTNNRKILFTLTVYSEDGTPVVTTPLEQDHPERDKDACDEVKLSSGQEESSYQNGYNTGYGDDPYDNDHRGDSDEYDRGYNDGMKDYDNYNDIPF